MQRRQPGEAPSSTSSCYFSVTWRHRFPRLRYPCHAGNGGSLEKCRRRWDLADNPQLQYKYMQSFDRAMNHLDKAFGFIGAPHTCVNPASSPEP